MTVLELLELETLHHDFLDAAEVLVESRDVLVRLHLVDDAVVVGVEAGYLEEVVEAVDPHFQVEHHQTQLRQILEVLRHRPECRHGAVRHGQLVADDGRRVVDVRRSQNVRRAAGSSGSRQSREFAMKTTPEFKMISSSF